MVQTTPLSAKLRFTLASNSKPSERSINVVPKPRCAGGPGTRGPPVSVQLNRSRRSGLPVTVQETASRPLASDKDPYFAALLAKFVDRHTLRTGRPWGEHDLGPSIRRSRPFTARVRWLMRSRRVPVRPAPRLVRRLCARVIALIRPAMVSANAGGEGFAGRVWVTMRNDRKDVLHAVIEFAQKQCSVFVGTLAFVDI